MEKYEIIETTNGNESHKEIIEAPNCIFAYLAVDGMYPDNFDVQWEYIDPKWCEAIIFTDTGEELTVTMERVGKCGNERKRK